MKQIYSGKMHELLIKSLRSREQEVFKYLGILAPALGGFAWLIYVTIWPSGTTTAQVADHEERFFVVGTIGVLLLLLLGAIYSLALGYNFRYITLELAKIESRLGISDAMLRIWPKRPCAFLRYTYCQPPDVIKYFWFAFVGGIIYVTAAACVLDCRVVPLVVPFGGLFALCALLAPRYFGDKLTTAARKEIKAWEQGEWRRPDRFSLI